MWEKNVTKTCALLRALWRGLFPLAQNCHASQGSSGSLREAGGEEHPQQVYTGSAEAVHGQIQRNCFFWGYLGGRKEQSQPAAGAVCLQGCHLQKSYNELLPTSRPSRSSSAPGPAQPSQSSSTPEINSGSSGPAAFPFWDGASRWVQGAGFHLQRSQKEN